MKSAIGGLVLAVVLFVAGAASWSEAQLTRRLSAAHQRMATLRYDTEDDLGTAGGVFERVLGRLATSGDDLARHRATASYWLSRYTSLTDIMSGASPQATSDSAVLLTAANASYRSAAPSAADKKGSIERLDAVIQGYADVLRHDPGLADAAYNFEFVTKARDALAKAPVPRPGAREAAPSAVADVSVDLPSGPTVHGRPGAPPEDVDMSDFKTITPMRYDEREEQMDPGRGRELRRKG